MRFASRQQATTLPGHAGTARVDRRLTAAVRRAEPGDVVVLDQIDLDRAHAEVLLRHRVGAVVNASPSISGRYPNLGPQLLADAGVVLVDDVGSEVFAALKDGTRVRVEDGTVYAAERAVATGAVLGPEEVRRRMQGAREGLTSQLQSLTHNTTEYLRREQDLLLHGLGVPELRTALAGRPAVVVVRDFDHETELRRLRRFVREQRPVLVGVDAGADTLIAAGMRPDLLVVGAGGLGGTAAAETSAGDGRVSDRALREAGEVVLHADPSGRVAGADRLARLGVRAVRIEAAGTTEDVALLVCDIRGASLLVSVGTHATLEEFLDRQRAGLASTFVTRLRVGPRLVDARSVPLLYAGRVRLWQLLLVLLAGLLAVAVAVALTPRGEVWVDQLGDALSASIDTLRGLLP